MGNTKYILIVGMPNSGKTTFNTVLQKKIIEEYSKNQNWNKDVNLLSSFVIPETINNNYQLLEQKEWIKITNYYSNKIKLEKKWYPEEIEIKELSGNFLNNLKNKSIINSEVKDFYQYLNSDSIIGIFLILDSKVLFEKKNYNEIDSNYSALFSTISNKNQLIKTNTSFFSIFEYVKEKKAQDKLPKIAIIANKLELFSEVENEKQLEESFANIYTKSYCELGKLDYKFFNVFSLGKIERNIDGNIYPNGKIEQKNIFKPLVWLGVVDDYSKKYDALKIILLLIVIVSFFSGHCGLSLYFLFFSFIFLVIIKKYKKILLSFPLGFCFLLLLFIIGHLVLIFIYLVTISFLFSLTLGR